MAWRSCLPVHTAAKASSTFFPHSPQFAADQALNAEEGSQLHRLPKPTGSLLTKNVSIGRRLCQVQGHAREKAPAEKRPERPARVYGARSPWRPGLARGPSSRRGLGWWPGVLAAADSPQLGQERALQLFPAVRVSSALSAPSIQAAIRAPATPLRDCSV
ncbi:hypothetical protein AB1E18_003252 [Capra hircus]